MGNKKKLLTVSVYLIPFVLLLLACLNFLISTAAGRPAADIVLFVAFHLLFLLSLCAVFGNLAIELLLTLFEDTRRSNLHALLYSGRRYLPVRAMFFTAVFIAFYILLAVQIGYRASVAELVLLLPCVAILFNARLFLSRRVRFVSGSYLYFSTGFHTIISYCTNASGGLVLITEEGRLYETGASPGNTDFEALQKELLQNGLKSGGKRI